MLLKSKSTDLKKKIMSQVKQNCSKVYESCHSSRANSTAPEQNHIAEDSTFMINIEMSIIAKMVPEQNLYSGEELLSDVPDFGIAVGCAEASFVLNATHTATVMSELYLTSVCRSFYVKIQYIHM